MSLDAYIHIDKISFAVLQALSFYDPLDNIIYCPTQHIREPFVWGKMLLGSLSLDHYGVIRHMVHCPTQPVLMTCGEDCRIKFWGYSSP